MWFEDIPLGGKTVLGSYSFTEENIIKFARQFDPQPFHIDAQAAKDSPYGGLTASGWHTAAVWMKLMVAHRYAQIASGMEATQENYISPGVREINGCACASGNEADLHHRGFQQKGLAVAAHTGLLQSMNEARDEEGDAYLQLHQPGVYRKEAG